MLDCTLIEKIVKDTSTKDKKHNQKETSSKNKTESSKVLCKVEENRGVTTTISLTTHRDKAIQTSKFLLNQAMQTSKGTVEEITIDILFRH